MQNIIKNYAKNMTRDDIVTYIKNNNYNVSEKEIDVIFYYIKKYYNVFFDNPYQYITILKGKISDENYNNILNILEKYKNYL